MGPGAQTYATELIEYMRRHDVQPMAYSPLGPTFNTTEKNELIEGNLTNSIGKKHGKSGAQVALRYVIQSGLALATRSDNPAYLAEDIDVYVRLFFVFPHKPHSI
jgi:diketogulonate reductase-like aldo/keto reductase